MKTAAPRRIILPIVLGIIALLCAALTAWLLYLAWPSIMAGDAPPTQPPTEPPTQVTTAPPTQPPTEPEPTLLPLDLNPYGKLDFQYYDGYLTCLWGESIVGIDVSAHQQEIDWDAVAAAGVKFAMIRVGYRGYGNGAIVEDSYARANIKGALKAGLEVGVYFFSQALNTEEAAEEAAFVLNFIKDYNITMPVVYDWEHVTSETARTAEMNDPEILTACAQTFLGAVEEAGYWPVMYFNTLQSRSIFNLVDLQEYDFWLALYSDRMTFPYQIEMWQYTCTGKIQGIQGNVDINIYFPET
ncbi:MAG: glycoside hydrolase family 25 protein [Oscillospiraceae bacterium]|nr:glycoside hydrolase family 25 protein [Oscillospiraceae bacterium]